MAKRFEELEVWQLSRKLAKDIYSLDMRHNSSLAYQIRRAAVSIMSNIAEGFERNGNQEFLQFLYIAKGSCGEVRCHLYIALDCENITQDEFRLLTAQAVRISVKLANLISHLRQSRYVGTKYRPRVEPSIGEVAEQILKEMNAEKNKVVQK